MDFLGEARALSLLGLDDPHLDLRGEAVVAAARDEAAVAAPHEEPRRLEIAQGDLELGQIGLMAAELAPQSADVRAECPNPGVLGTRLGRLRGARGLARVIDLAVGAHQPWSRRGQVALQLVELIAERLPPAERFAIRRAVALAHTPQDVGAVGDRLVGLRDKAVDPGIDRIPRVAILGQIGAVAQSGR